MANHCVIIAAGSGRRMGSGVNKVFLAIEGVPVVIRAARAFQQHNDINTIVLVTREEDIEELLALVSLYGITKVRAVIAGGRERQDSVYNGLKEIEAALGDIVLIHNGANPFIDPETISACIKEASLWGAAAAAQRSKDTVKRVDGLGFVSETLKRDELWQMQTPQAVRYEIIMGAFKSAIEADFYGTDDVSLVERIGLPVKIVECGDANIKITTPGDLAFGEQILRGSLIGFGMDSHRFIDESDKPCVLGGINIPEAPGFLANSDGDVLLHALFNAVAQAMGENSIGFFADPICESGVTDSSEYMKIILGIMRSRLYEIGNIGVMIEGKKPRISGREKAIKNNLSRITGVSEDRIGITATSGEGLTDFGRGLGVQCFCVVTLVRADW
jgi:2-C-methyl-D-erythritol 4-phosphate cytidylyltransferase/2-C-methyl-D-erythritol 2,4-cyclodiphosphate synthase